MRRELRSSAPFGDRWRSSSEAATRQVARQGPLATCRVASPKIQIPPEQLKSAHTCCRSTNVTEAPRTQLAHHNQAAVEQDSNGQNRIAESQSRAKSCPHQRFGHGGFVGADCTAVGIVLSHGFADSLESGWHLGSPCREGPVAFGPTDRTIRHDGGSGPVKVPRRPIPGLLIWRVQGMTHSAP
jgi:hypothetical protein